ncbi:MAG: SPOR domain-containing protein [Terriglobales bacterium]
MSSAPQDTEITLGTGRMLALFCGLVLVCAVFFAVGFSLGRKAGTAGGANLLAGQAQTPAAVVRPSAGKNNSPQAPSSDQFGFYKAVEQKSADTQLAPHDSPPQTAAAAAPAEATSIAPKTAAPDPATPPANAYYVQVAAVTRQEDADALVEALKNKQYPAFRTNPSADKFFRVQVGPFAEIKDAEATRARLVADGYTPILKK